jgi:hypothetical protein
MNTIRAALLLLQERERGPGREEVTLDQHVIVLPPELYGRLLDRRRRRQARIRNQDVDPAELDRAGIKRCAHLGLARHVADFRAHERRDRSQR